MFVFMRSVQIPCLTFKPIFRFGYLAGVWNVSLLAILKYEIPLSCSNKMCNINYYHAMTKALGAISDTLDLGRCRNIFLKFTMCIKDMVETQVRQGVSTGIKRRPYKGVGIY